MQFEWDEQKNQANIRRHGLSFAEAWQIFTAFVFTQIDDREEYREDRWIGIGALGGRVVVIVFTERGDNVIRIISLRKATHYERNTYWQALRNRLGPS